MDDNAKNTDNVTSADRPKKNNYNQNRSRNYYKNKKKNSGGSGEISGNARENRNSGGSGEISGNVRENRNSGGSGEISGNAREDRNSNNHGNNSRGGKQSYNKNYSGSRNNDEKNGSNGGNSRTRGKNYGYDKNGGTKSAAKTKTKGYYMTKVSTDEDFDELFKDVFGNESAEDNFESNYNFANFEENEQPRNEIKKNHDSKPKKKKKSSVKIDDEFSEVSEIEEVSDFDFPNEEEVEQPTREVKKTYDGKPKKKKKSSVKRADEFSEKSENSETVEFSENTAKNKTAKKSGGEGKKTAEKSSKKSPKNFSEKDTAVIAAAVISKKRSKNTFGESTDKAAAVTSKKHGKNTFGDNADKSPHTADSTKKDTPDLAENKKKSETRFWSRLFSLGVIVPIYAALVICTAFLPRSTVSNLEKRNLSTFPEFSWGDYWNGTYTSGITHYFDDTVPFRDSLKQAASQITNLFGIKYNNVQVTGQMQVVNDKNSDKQDSTESSSTSDSKKKTSSKSADTESDSEESTTPKGQEIADGVYTNGTIVVYQNGHYRSMAMYGGGTGDAYVDAVNKFAEDLPSVKVYSMVDPTSSEFYTPVNFSDYNASQSDDIESINSRLKNVRGINVCSTLAKHVDENIYTRTDHHWMSLGAYYAAERFAQEAGVSFRNLNQYSKKKTPGYVGTMYSFSDNNANLLNDPEDFIYYVPKTKDYTVEYYDYAFNFAFEGDLMVEAYDISEMYSSYIGGDSYSVKISTGVNNGRKLCLVKDSYGNALPQFWIGSFEEIYVVDMRYFELNLVDFVKENKITDLLFSCCSYSAVGPNADNLEYLRTMGKYEDIEEDSDEDEETDTDTEDVSSIESVESTVEDSDIYDNTSSEEENIIDVSSEEEDDFFDNINVDDDQVGYVGNINDDDIFGGDDDNDSENIFEDDEVYDEDYY